MVERRRRGPPPHPPAPGELTDGDRALWAAVARTVTPLGPRPPGPAQILDERRERKPAAPAGSEARARDHRAAPRPQLRETMTPRLAGMGGMDRRQAERLRRGRLRLEGTLDLHGYSREEARERLDAFLDAAEAKGTRSLLVITGKGPPPTAASVAGEESETARSARPGGVLRRMLPRWLGEGRNRVRVLAFSPARPEHGGEGAWYVLLRRRR